MVHRREIQSKLPGRFSLRLTVLPLLVSGTLIFNTPVKAEIFVAAASSLTDVLQAVSKAYESRQKARVIFSFGASSDLARQIAEGAPVDIFVSADEEKMNQLEHRGLIDRKNRKNLLSNQMVIVTLKGSPLQIKAPVDLLRAEVKRIAMAEPSSIPGGLYAKSYFEKEGLWHRIESKVIPVSSVRAVVATVESGNVDVGVVYKTDVPVSQILKIAYEVDFNEGPEIVYPAAILEGSKNREEAEDFFEFLFGDTARAVFKNYGFIVLK